MKNGLRAPIIFFELHHIAAYCRTMITIPNVLSTFVRVRNQRERERERENTICRPELCPVAVQKKRKKDTKKLDEESNKDGRKKGNSGSRTKANTCSPSFALASSNSNKGKLCLKPSDPAKKMSGGKEVLGAMKDRSVVDSVSDINTKDQGSKLLDVNEPLESDSFLMEHKDMSTKVPKPITVQKVIKEDNLKETMLAVKTFI